MKCLNLTGFLKIFLSSKSMIFTTTLFRSSQDAEILGVIPRAVKDIFNYIRENVSTEYLVKVTAY